MLNAHEMQIRAALALGFKREGNALACSGRKGYLFGPSPDQSVKEKVAIARNPDGTPAECSCEHEALEMVESLYGRILILQLLASALGTELPPIPQPEDFMYVFVEDHTEPEVTSMDEAGSILDSIRRKQ